MSSRGQQLRIGLFGRLGSGNIGNDATMEAILAYLRADHPHAALDCMCSGPEHMTRKYDLPATQLHWFHGERRIRSRLVNVAFTAVRIAVGAVIDTWRTAAWVRRHDVVIVPGMGVLESTVAQRPWQLPYSLFLLSSFGWLLGTKVAFVSVGATVVPQRLTGRLLAMAAKLAYYRSFRDEYSLAAARQMGFAGHRDQVYPDLVFALPTPPAPRELTRTAGVGVMAYYGTASDRGAAEQLHAEYLAKMKAIVRWLVESGHRVRFLIGDAVDEPVVQQIIDDVRTYWKHSGDVPVEYEPFSSVAELMDQVAPLDVVVATRFHNVLAALKRIKPTVAIGYGGKHNALMTQMGVGAFAHDIRSFDVDRVTRQVVALETTIRDQVMHTLAEQNRLIHQQLEAQFAELDVVLFATNTSRVESSIP